MVDKCIMTQSQQFSIFCQQAVHVELYIAEADLGLLQHPRWSALW